MTDYCVERYLLGSSLWTLCWSVVGRRSDLRPTNEQKDIINKWILACIFIFGQRHHRTATVMCGWVNGRGLKRREARGCVRHIICQPDIFQDFFDLIPVHTHFWFWVFNIRICQASSYWFCSMNMPRICTGTIWRSPKKTISAKYRGSLEREKKRVESSHGMFRTHVLFLLTSIWLSLAISSQGAFLRER